MLLLDKSRFADEIVFNRTGCTVHDNPQYVKGMEVRNPLLLSSTNNQVSVYPHRCHLTFCI